MKTRVFIGNFWGNFRLNKSKNVRYYGLRLVSTFYKVFAIFTAIIMVGAMGYSGIAAINSPANDTVDFLNWFQANLGILLGGGLLTFTFIVISQLIDLLLSMSAEIGQLVNQNEDTLKGIEAANKLMTAHVQQMNQALDQQARLARLQGQQTPSAPPTPLQAQTKAVGKT